MSPGSAPTPQRGHQAQRPCRRCPDRVADGRPSCCGAMASTIQSASRRSPTSCRPRPGTTSPGARAARTGCLALRPPAGAAGASRHLASRAARRGVVADRVAARRARADQILAFHHAQRHRLRSPRRFGEIALADRARLPGTQAGARLWRLRRAWVARLSPPRHTLYRRLRLPDRRTRRPSPLRTALHPALLGICPSRRLPTPRRRRSAPNGMCRTRSQPSADVLSSPSPGPSRDALVAMRQSEKPAKFPITDVVRLRYGIKTNPETLAMSTVDANRVILTGENSVIRLGNTNSDSFTTNATFWRILSSPGGPGHVL